MVTKGPRDIFILESKMHYDLWVSGGKEVKPVSMILDCTGLWLNLQNFLNSKKILY